MREHETVHTEPEPIGKLPSGRHRLSRDYVVNHQVTRILAAVIEVTGTTGYAQLTVEAVIGRAGVSRSTFYEHFRNKDDAFLRAYDTMAARLMDSVTDAYKQEEDALGRLRAGLSAFLEFLAAEPLAARTCIVESLAAGPRAAARRDEAKQAFVQLVADNIRELFPAYPEPGLTAETIVGGIHEVVHTRIRRDEIAELPALLPALLNVFAIPDPERWGPDATAPYAREPEAPGTAPLD
ncbi:DNA-binding transcriptional regulator, AcrR family [Thermomonospora echinospora]|uniref:DNA-binding transcriptional regulator, AcrR family n=1 Tax=Thermomonospora echinospora TaxID=1992 RepID=A0A1H5W4S5_9ACTN|nr:TetR/AcrR family transcriptional regulator [Thermomonospora echinospora]SEF93827.1 DNA-binding transcriptional regulator, AcrR family [Thermomonospora echinospora]